MARPAVFATLSVVFGVCGVVALLQSGVIERGRGEPVAVAAVNEPVEARVLAEPAASPSGDSASTTTAPAMTVATTTSATTTSPQPRRTAQLAFTGDILAHRGVVRQAAANATDSDAEYDFSPMFELVEPVLSAADLAICHLETPLSPDNDDLSGFPTFSVPHEMAQGLVAAGYDGCSFASNHSLDRRPEGVIETLDILDAAGLGHSGAARSQAEYDDVTIYDAGGIAVANLSYSYGFNGFREPSDTPWLVNEISIDEITDEVDRARASGAEYVALSLHWGTENRTTPDAFQQEIAEQVSAIDGIDIVIGHHAHVVQPVDVIGDLPVVFGLGNFLSNQSANCCAAGSQDGVIMQVNIQEVPGPDGTEFETWLTYVPTWVDRSDFSIVPVAEVLDGTESIDDDRRALLTRSRQRTADAIRERGNRLVVVEDR